MSKPTLIGWIITTFSKKHKKKVTSQAVDVSPPHWKLYNIVKKAPAITASATVTHAMYTHQ